MMMIDWHSEEKNYTEYFKHIATDLCKLVH